MKILISGANGFVGKALCREAAARGDVVHGTARSKCDLPGCAESSFVGSIDVCTDWHKALVGCDCVIHLAARAHVIKEIAIDPLAVFRTVNVDAALNLAKQAVLAGVKRFVFISSIGVNGGVTNQKPFAYDDEAAPHSSYAITKHEAEVALKKLARDTGMEVVIIRSPLVYGPDSPGNFGALMRWVARGRPLPFGGAEHNRRSLVALDNLIDLIMLCTKHPNAANQTFLVSDGEDISTAELLQRIGKALHRPVRLLYVPVSWLTMIANLLGKKAVAQSLLGSLRVDISHTCETLGWKPPIGVDEGLRRAVQGFGQ